MGHECRSNSPIGSTLLSSSVAQSSHLLAFSSSAGLNSPSPTRRSTAFSGSTLRRCRAHRTASVWRRTPQPFTVSLLQLKTIPLVLNAPPRLPFGIMARARLASSARHSNLTMNLLRASSTLRGGSNTSVLVASGDAQSPKGRPARHLGIPLHQLDSHLALCEGVAS